MNKINIAVDIDNCVAKTIREICKRLGEPYENVTSWDYLKNKYGSRAFWNMYHQAWQWGDIEACEGVRELLQGFQKLDLTWGFVTAMPENVIGYAVKWLVSNGLYLSHPVIKVESTVDKLKLGYTHYIDDSPELAENISKGKMLFLIRKKWNLHIRENKRIILVNSYSKIQQYFGGVK